MMREKMSIAQKTKKSQAEIIGITIVMVLIMIGIIFVIRFVVLPEDYDVKEAFDQTQLAANFIDASLKTTTHCNKLTVTQLIQDCFEHFNEPAFLYACPDDSSAPISFCPGGCTSCTYLNATLGHMLEQSLVPMNTRYDFLICAWDAPIARCQNVFPEDIISNFSHRSCLASAIPNWESKQQPIPTDVGNRVAQMYICN